MCAGTPPVSACGLREPCHTSATLARSSSPRAPPMKFSMNVSCSARLPGSADGPELSRVSDAGSQPAVSTASLTTRPPNECPARCRVRVAAVSPAMSVPSAVAV